jgi:hypothetical protein
MAKEDGDVLQHDEAADPGISLGLIGMGVVAREGITFLDESISWVIQDDPVSSTITDNE